MAAKRRLRRRLPRLLLPRKRLRQQRPARLHRAYLRHEGKKRTMSSSTTDPQDADLQDSDRLTAAVITVSDSCSRGERKDLSGPAVAQTLEGLGFSIKAREVVSDDKIQIQNCLIK